MTLSTIEMVTRQIATEGNPLATVIYFDGTDIYVCKALCGTALTSATWRVCKIQTATDIIIEWADGDDKFDNVATDLATVKALSFS